MENIEIDSSLSFGGYNWRVLDTQNNMALIITEDIIDQRPYHDAYKDTTWADCVLRKYLNGEFYDKFNATDKSRIISVINKNLDNQWYGSKGGADTQDSVFLLSIEEVCKYFGDSSSKLQNQGKNQRYWFERKDENNSKRIARLQSKERIWWWWLRSPGRANVKAVYIHGDGNIGIQGNNILKGNISDGKCTGGVRPAVRMVCAYYEDSVFYVSTDAKKNKMLQIEKNNEVSIGGLGWYAFQGRAENLGWVKDEKNVEIRAKFKKTFDWFDEVGDEANPNSIVLRISLIEGTITDNEKKYGECQYEIDFINKTAK